MSETGGSNSVIPLYKESLAVGKRDVDAGSVRVKKIVKTETVNQPVELRHEEIVIERVPASDTASASGAESAFQEQETVIHLTKEEPVVEKQTASAGQVVLQTRSSSRETNIQAQVRSEDVAVVKSGDTENVTVGQNVHEGGEAMGAAETPSGEAAGEAKGGLITEPAMLFSSTSEISGRTVQFSNLKVQSVSAGNTVACLDAGNGKQLYIYCSKGAPALKAGDVVDLRGTVETSASNMTDAQTQILGSQPAYIRAETIDHAGR